MAKRYLMGQITGLGQFSIVGLECRNIKRKSGDLAWMARGGFTDFQYAEIVQEQHGAVKTKAGDVLQVTNEGYKAGAFEAFVAEVWGAKA